MEVDNVKPGQVWAETVTPKDEGFPPWEKLHFVVSIKKWWMLDVPCYHVLSNTKDGPAQTDLREFIRFRKLDVEVDINRPCIEQRTLEELLANTSPTAHGREAIEAAQLLLALIDEVGTVGGFHRKTAVGNAIKALRDVAASVGEDTKSISQEIWLKNL
jgi:hypothetical protein